MGEGSGSRGCGGNDGAWDQLWPTPADDFREEAAALTAGTRCEGEGWRMVGAAGVGGALREIGGRWL